MPFERTATGAGRAATARLARAAGQL